MLDIFYIGICLAFFALCAWMVRGFTMLQPEDYDE
jgi:hypothetical protein